MSFTRRLIGPVDVLDDDLQAARLDRLAEQPGGQLIVADRPAEAPGQRPAWLVGDVEEPRADTA